MIITISDVCSIISLLLSIFIANKVISIDKRIINSFNTNNSIGNDSKSTGIGNKTKQTIIEK